MFAFIRSLFFQAPATVKTVNVAAELAAMGFKPDTFKAQWIRVFYVNGDDSAHFQIVFYQNTNGLHGGYYGVYSDLHATQNFYNDKTGTNIVEFLKNQSNVRLANFMTQEDLADHPRRDEIRRVYFGKC